jgi:hypothetical protein
VFGVGHHGEQPALEATVYCARQIQMPAVRADQEINAPRTVFLQSLDAVVVTIKDADHCGSLQGNAHPIEQRPPPVTPSNFLPERWLRNQPYEQ